MSIAFYPQVGESVPNMFSADPEYGDAIPVLDANHLYNECAKRGIPTDWWYPLANTITLNAGEEPSVAYLLINRIFIDGAKAKVAQPLTGINKDIPALKRSKHYSHKIVLSDTFSTLDEDKDPDYTAPIEVVGWVFHSARAIDGSDDSGDLATAYLVKFVDVRWLLARRPWWANHGESSQLNIGVAGINLSDKSALADGMSGDLLSGVDFPYSATDFSVMSWEDALSTLWYGPAYAYVASNTLPTGGDYPDQGPIDYFTNNRNSFELFCELLHASGNELFQKLDGTFTIKPIDDHFNKTSALVPYKLYQVEQGHPIPDDKLVPEFVSVRMRLRGDPQEITSQASNYMTNYIYRVSDQVAELNVGTSLVGASVTPYDGEILAGANDTPTYSYGIIDDVLTPAVAYIEWMPKTATDYWDYLDHYSRHIAEKLIKSRLDNQVDVTYGRFIPLAPCPEFERVTFFLYNGAPATRFESVPSKIYKGTSLEYMAQSTSDRLVAANTDDDTPKTLYEKIEDKDDYNPETHQLVWAEVVTHGTDPTKDNKVRFFTTLGTGDPGPPGATGPPGADGPTYTAGCGIDVSGTVIGLSSGDLIGVGMQLDPQSSTDCSISPFPPDLAGNGLIAATDNAANEEVFIKVRPSDLYDPGGGLTEPSTGNSNARDGLVKLKIKPQDLVTDGSGLMVATDSSNLTAAGPVKIKIRPADLCGKGLKVSSGDQDDANGPVKIEINNDDADMIEVNSLNDVIVSTVGGLLTVEIVYSVVKVHGKYTGTSDSFVDGVATTECPA